ncbi:MAG TPA: metal ABC transporter permease [Alloiococcus sp.]|nr:metal ABC transporter permease [Alloiococcus sp.]
MSDLSYLLNDYTFQMVALGTGILGITSGIVGTYVTLRQESLLGDALSHAALPGIAIAFMLIQVKVTALLLVGAVITGLIATVLMQVFSQKTVLKLDSAMALTLSTFFGLGLVLMTYIQRQANANQAGLSNFIFGQASAMLNSDVQLIVGVSLFILLIITILWRPFKLMTFDMIFAKTVYSNLSVYQFVLSLLIVMTIMIGLESVGVILISSLLIGPSITARQWSDNLLPVMLLSGMIGGLSGVIGTLISSLALRIPTGPAIVVVLSLFLFASLLFAPNKGLIARSLKVKRQRQDLIKQLEEESL